MDRAAFEAWHSLVHAPGYPQMVSMKNPDGTYVYIESEWKAWQAATLAAKQQAGVIVLKDGRSVPVMADFRLTITGGGGGGGSGGSNAPGGPGTGVPVLKRNIPYDYGAKD